MTLPSQVAAVVLVLYTDTVCVPLLLLHTSALALSPPSSPPFTDFDCRYSVLVLPSQQERRRVMAGTAAAARGKAPLMKLFDFGTWYRAQRLHTHKSLQVVSGEAVLLEVIQGSSSAVHGQHLAKD